MQDGSFEVFDATLFEAHRIGVMAAIWITGRIVDFHLVEARRQRLDLFQAVQDCAMLQTGDARGHKDAEMADMRVDQIDDALARLLQVLGAGVDGWNPTQRLMGRRDVVSKGGEDDKRIVDATQIDEAVGTNLELASLKAVADEQILDYGHHLLAAEKVEAIPPAFEFEKALALLVDMREEIGVLLPNTFRFEVLEVLDQPCAVEPAITEISGQMSEPSSAKKATGNTCRVDSGFSGPIWQRRA